MLDCASASKATIDGATGPCLDGMVVFELPAGVCVFDAADRLMFTNPAFRSLYGLSELRLRTGMPSNVVLQAIGAAQSHVLGKPIDAAAVVPRSLKSVRGDRVRVTIQSLPNGGWLELHMVEPRSLTSPEPQASDDDIEHLPYDALKARFLGAVDEHIRAAMAGSLVAVHAFKIDGLDAVQKDHGATTAQMVRRLVAKRLKAALREGDHIFEVSDERFAVMQTALDTADQADALALRLLKALNAPYRIATSLVKVSVRSGIAIAPTDAKDAASALERADAALYSLPQGAARHRAYADMRATFIFDREAMAQELATALEAGELKIFYQPIIDIHKLEVAGFEALMRWHHPDHGLIPTASFISVAEETGLITKLGTWAVETACRDAATWSGKYRVSVNFSGQQFGCEDPVEAVRHALVVSGLEPARLEIEVTETALLQNEVVVHRQLSELQKIGVKVALDDFGAAYATLANLRDFHFDKIKIDRSFVGDMRDRKNCAAIVKAVAGLADALDIRSVAEGVETMDQLREVCASGYTEIQGFYFSVAVPADQIPKTLQDCEEKLALLRQ